MINTSKFIIMESSAQSTTDKTLFCDAKQERKLEEAIKTEDDKHQIAIMHEENKQEANNLYPLQ